MTETGDFGTPPDEKAHASPPAGRESLPRPARVARWILYVQAGLGGLGVVASLFLLALAANMADHGEDGAGTVVALAVLGGGLAFGQAAIALAFGLRVRTERRSGLRTAIVVFECVIIGLQVLNVIGTLLAGGSGSVLVGGGIGIGLAVSVLVHVGKDEAMAYFIE